MPLIRSCSDGGQEIYKIHYNLTHLGSIDYKGEASPKFKLDTSRYPNRVICGHGGLGSSEKLFAPNSHFVGDVLRQAKKNPVTFRKQLEQLRPAKAGPTHVHDLTHRSAGVRIPSILQNK